MKSMDKKISKAIITAGIIFLTCGRAFADGPVLSKVYIEAGGVISQIFMDNYDTDIISPNYDNVYEDNGFAADLKQIDSDLEINARIVFLLDNPDTAIFNPFLRFNHLAVRDNKSSIKYPSGTDYMKANIQFDASYIGAGLRKYIVSAGYMKFYGSIDAGLFTTYLCNDKSEIDLYDTAGNIAVKSSVDYSGSFAGGCIEGGMYYRLFGEAGINLAVGVRIAYGDMHGRWASSSTMIDGKDGTQPVNFSGIYSTLNLVIPFWDSGAENAGGNK
jgi:hypothetical protein